MAAHRAVPLGLLLASLLFGATTCAPMSQRLSDLVEEGSYDDVIARGTEWADEHASEPDDAAEVRRVRHLVATARLRKATAYDSVAAYQTFRQQHERDALYADLVEDALERESLAYYRDRTLTAEAVSEHREFRSRYPDSSQVGASRQREVDLALAAALAADTVPPYGQFRADYDAWPEAAAALAQVRPREVEAAFRDARAAGSVAAYGAFRAAYRDWPEAAPRLAEAFELEAELAFAAALAERNIPALRIFRRDYGAPHWVDRADQAEVRLALRPFLDAAAEGTALPDPTVTHFLARYGRHRFLGAEAAGHEDALWKAAKKSKRAEPLRLFRTLYPASSRVADCRRAEPGLAWKALRDCTEAARFLLYAQNYPDDSRAGAAEAHYYALRAAADADRLWPRATIQHRAIRGREVEGRLEVRDCNGERISGLTREQFEVYAGAERLDVLEFAGLEDDRPIDIVFAIDLSGSMETERNAVHRAVLRFVDVFRFRNRDTRLGLVTFNEAIRLTNRPDSRPERFRDWLNESMRGTSGGAAGEDGVGALLKGADLGLRSAAERVTIMLSDEHLQVNATGRAALGGKAAKVCQQLAKTRDCMQRCRNVNCLAGCAGRMGGDTGRWFKQCVKRHGKVACLRALPLDRLGSCSEPVAGGSDLMERLVQRLAKDSIRPFFLVPDSDRGSPIIGYGALSAGLDGRILTVPSDSKDESPYVRALMEIAEQLSREYSIRFRAAGPITRTTPVRVRVRHLHAWTPAGPAPSAPLDSLHGVARPDGSKRLVAVTRQGGVLERADDSGAWTAWPLPAVRGSVVASFVGAGALTLVTTEGDVVTAPLGEGAPVHTAASLPPVVAAALAADEDLWLVGCGADSACQVFRRPKGSADFASVRAVQRGERAVPVLFQRFTAEGAALCLMTTPEALTCTTDDGATWTETSCRGLPERAFEGRARLLPIERPGLLLLVGADGAVYRSLSDGRSWDEVLPTDGTPRTLALAGGVRRAVCVASGTRTHCSEDGGRSWFALARRFPDASAATIAASGGDLHLAHAGTLYRLERVTNREIPSSSVYFDTDSDVPSAALRPYLHEIAGAMSRDARLHLRVEGHADQRGSDEHNEALAARRAESVAAQIAALGVSGDRIQTLSFGERLPVRDGGGPDALARNRRVELILLRRMPRGGWGDDDCD